MECRPLRKRRNGVGEPPNVLARALKVRTGRTPRPSNFDVHWEPTTPDSASETPRLTECLQTKPSRFRLKRHFGHELNNAHADQPPAWKRSLCTGLLRLHGQEPRQFAANLLCESIISTSGKSYDCITAAVARIRQASIPSHMSAHRHIARMPSATSSLCWVKKKARHCCRANSHTGG
jgi:hypothetical protein